MALVESGSHIDAKDDWGDSWTALHYAARGGHTGIIATLLEAGAAINIMTDYTRCTPLHEVALSR